MSNFILWEKVGFGPYGTLCYEEIYSSIVFFFFLLFGVDKSVVLATTYPQVR